MKRDGTLRVGSLVADPGPAFPCPKTHQPRDDTLRTWLGGAGRGGSEELFLKEKKKNKPTKIPGPFDGSNAGSLGAGRDVPGWLTRCPPRGSVALSALFSEW